MDVTFVIRVVPVGVVDGQKASYPNSADYGDDKNGGFIYLTFLHGLCF